jgi:succinyl-CoA synthetase alpha subunit
MADTVIIRKNAYHDSVTLMALSGKIKSVPGVTEAVVAMATALNKDLLQSVGLWTTEVSDASESDLVLAVRAESEEVCQQAMEAANNLLAKKPAGAAGTLKLRPSSIQAALNTMPDANLAVISVPGRFAAREAEKALNRGMNVMLFSDNVTLAEEKKLKEMAHASGLLMMGPDCGTAIINGVDLCFANAVRSGNIGVIGASGTGLQEVTVCIDRLGGGISQAFGVGGRDLQEAIGGIMMLDTFAVLCEDPKTDVIVLVSKPPAASVAAKIQQAVDACNKPVVFCFVGDAGKTDSDKIYVADTLEAAAIIATALANGQKPVADVSWQQQLASQAKPLAAALTPQQRYVRGLFCGGTLCGEAVTILHHSLGKVYSNTGKADQLADIHTSQQHTCIDLGDDVFTIGRPHPMIEPSLRLPRLLSEAADPEVAVILLDVVLGYGSHPDPAGLTAPAIKEAIAIAAAQGRCLVVIAYVCGTEGDPQIKAMQEKILVDAGAILADSNARAAWLAAAIAQGRDA